MADPDADYYVGITACGESWLAVAFDERGFDHVRVCPGIGDCWAHYEETGRRLLIDVPVGLIDSGDPERRCDELARALVGPQAGTVYTPPVREATRKRRYSAANRVHERKSDAPLSEAAFEAREEIAMVDELLQEVPEAAAVVRAAHPELCYRALDGDVLEQARGTAAGYAERMRVLAHYDRDAAPTVQRAAQETSGHTVRVEDVLDAVVLAYTATPTGGELWTLPTDPPTDTKGLPVEWVYRAETQLSTDE